MQKTFIEILMVQYNCMILWVYIFMTGLKLICISLHKHYGFAHLCTSYHPHQFLELYNMHIFQVYEFVSYLPTYRKYLFGFTNFSIILRKLLLCILFQQKVFVKSLSKAIYSDGNHKKTAGKRTQIYVAVETNI